MPLSGKAGGALGALRGQLLTDAAVVGQATHSIGQRRGVADRHQQAVAARIQYFRGTMGAVGRDHRHAQAQRFNQHVAEAFTDGA
ncbi:hypothetical protein G6F68_014379 [Rhizopus microsporus]|nr:hypothetical protein G6F68_014379 [Rhizopus microsporus]